MIGWPMLIVAILIISVASSTRADREEARARVAKYNLPLLIVTVIGWTWLIGIILTG